MLLKFNPDYLKKNVSRDFALRNNFGWLFNRSLISFPLVLIIIISSVFFLSFSLDSIPTFINNWFNGITAHSIFHEDNKTEEKDSLITVKLSFVGDLMCHSVQYEYAHVNEDSFDFLPVYSEILPYFYSKDIVFGNLESVFAGKEEKYSGFPFFNSPDDYLVALKRAGFNYLNTANNHSLDRKEKGLLRTITKLKELDINYFGTYESEKDRDSIRIFEKEGFKIALLGYSYGTNGLPIPKGKPYLINLIDTSLIRTDIKKATECGADISIVYFHWGEEYQTSPNTDQAAIADFTFSVGADFVIASHPHVLQKIVFFKKDYSKSDSNFVAYSLGNFISNQQWRYSDAGAILDFILTKNKISNRVHLSDVNLTPTWVFKGLINGKKRYLILPSSRYSDSTYTFLSKTNRDKMEEAYFDSKNILFDLKNIDKINVNKDTKIYKQSETSKIQIAE